MTVPASTPLTPYATLLGFARYVDRTGRGLRAPLLVMNANRVRSVTKPTVQLAAQSVAAVGNITSNGIEPLPAQWTALNITA